MSEGRRRVDRVLDASYSAGLEGRSEEDLRSMKAECVEVETEVSFVRRLAQGRIDIIEAERQRRAEGGSTSDLVQRLPQILADEIVVRPDAAHARVSDLLAPSPDIEWTRGLEQLIADSTLVRLFDLSDDELAQAMDQLRALENEMSTVRRKLHEVIDGVERELTDRAVAQEPRA
jgi:hypothetical protein